ncbi:MAG: GNAT family N-acetyltransferase [Anaerolineae bacterium]
MSLHLRPELPGDEEAIDRVNFLAFDGFGRGIGGGLLEAHLVRRLRALPAFDPAYSITAWSDETTASSGEGCIVGHALFTPCHLRLMGRTVRALELGPLAVLPERQRQGIGGELIRYGHDLGRRDGYQLVLLLGHPSYYPRHGYVPAFGFAQVKVDLDILPQPSRGFCWRTVETADLPWLRDRALAEWGDVDFAEIPGPHLDEWTTPGVNSLIWLTEDGRRAAYTVAVDRGGQRQWHYLLADDPDIARDVIATARPATLEHHPSGWLARHVIRPEWATVTANPSDAAMAAELEPGVLQPYLEAVAAGRRPTGACNYGLPFLLC